MQICSIHFRNALGDVADQVMGGETAGSSDMHKTDHRDAYPPARVGPCDQSLSQP